jgi:hypothetical protein
MASTCLKLKVKALGLSHKLHGTLTCEIFPRVLFCSLTHQGITVDKLQDRTSLYSAIIRSPTASPEILPRGGSMGGMDN